MRRIVFAIDSLSEYQNLSSLLAAKLTSKRKSPKVMHVQKTCELILGYSFGRALSRTAGSLCSLKEMGASPGNPTSHNVRHFSPV